MESAYFEDVAHGEAIVLLFGDKFTLRQAPGLVPYGGTGAGDNGCNC